MSNWISDTFSAQASDNDLIKSRSLNITRIANVAVPVVSGIGLAISEIANTPPFDEPVFQRQLCVTLVGLIAVVSVADIIARAIVSRPPRAYSTLNKPVEATQRLDGFDRAGHVIGIRTASTGTELLFHGADGKLGWVSDASISLTK